MKKQNKKKRDVVHELESLRHTARQVKRRDVECSFRVREVDSAHLEKDLAALLKASDDVVLAGAGLRFAAVLTSSGEDVVTYTDRRVLRVWKGSHKVGDLLTYGMWIGSIMCGPDPKDFTGTQVGSVPVSMFNFSGPDGPVVLFLHKDKAGEIEGLRLTGGGGVQGMFNLGPSDNGNTKTSLVCHEASFDHLACQTYYELSHRKRTPEWCREPAIDLQNVATCNAIVNDRKELIVAFGVNQDPVRNKYNGMPVMNFLAALLQAAADSSDVRTTPTLIPSK